MTVWARHEQAGMWCAVSDTNGHSIVTYCRGRWSLRDVYEIHSDPPKHETRCSFCADRAAEIEAVLEFKNRPDVHDAFDLGGES